MTERSKILVVDDRPTNVEVLWEILEDSYDLRSASNGLEALEAVAEFNPDLVLLDIMMPGMDGFEVCRSIRARAKSRYIKIILVSAKSLVSDRLEGYAHGADDYVTKPFDADELLSKVQVFLRLRSVEELDELKTKLLAMLVDEVRSPLQSLSVPARLLLDNELTQEKTSRIASLMLSNIGRLRCFFERIGLLCELRSSRVEVKPERHSMKTLVEGCLDDMSDRAKRRSVSFGVTLDEDAPVFCDATLLGQALSVLIENAVRFTPSDNEVSIDLSTRDDHAELRVTDRGKGFDSSALEGFFDEFSDVDTRGESEDDGYLRGVSLALCREIIERHDGEVRVESERGQGTTYSVVVPLALNVPTMA